MSYLSPDQFTEHVARYAASLNRTLKTGDATEHSHRRALENFLSALAPRATIVNEPQRKTGYGAPDLLVTKANLPLGYVETKDIGDNLTKTEKSDQLVRYREGLSNLVLTDYCEFRRYRDGEGVAKIALLTRDKKGQWQPNAEAMDEAALFFGQFLDYEGEKIARAKVLAARLAGLTRLMRHAVAQALEFEKHEARQNNLRLETLSFHEQLGGFREVLIHDLAEQDFADIYAQTIAYGFFTARFHKKDAQAFTRERAAFLIPQNNEFLARTFARICGADVRHGLDWALDDLAALLDRTDMDAILTEFRGSTAAKTGWRVDPVYYFYEDFLAEYNPKLREARGVYYTPGPVVDYIVRSVDKILMRDFGLKDGLADREKIKWGDAETHRLHILDPAAGTGTFFHHLMDHLYHGRFAKTQGAWPQYVKDHLLPRLHGFEFLMAPYAIAHLKLALQLQDQGVRLDRTDRINIILTNTLEEAKDLDNPPMFTQWLVDEAKRANRVKMQTPVMAIIGNPPYSGDSKNPSERRINVQAGKQYLTYNAKSLQPIQKTAKKDMTVTRRTFIGHLMRGWDTVSDQTTGSYFHVDGAPLGEKNSKWINDDYVKFMRFAQWRIERTGHGVLGFITNHGYLDNPTFRGMRHSLMQTFDEIYLLDLHGNAKKRERAPDGGEDKNVFDIEQGVAIALFVKRQNPSTSPLEGEVAASRRVGGSAARLARVFHADLWGPREVWDSRGKDRQLIGGKYAWLADHDVTNTEWTELNPASPSYLFIPRVQDLAAEYDKGWSVADIFGLNSVGIVTARDGLCIQFTTEDMKKTAEAFLGLSVDEARERFSLGPDARDWRVEWAQEDLKKNWDQSVSKILYRPFDIRTTIYTGRSRGFICMPRTEVMSHMLRDNLAISVSKQSKESFDTLITKSIAGHKSVNSYDINYLFPLYLYPDATKHKKDLFDGGGDEGREIRDAQGRMINLAPDFINAIAAATDMTFDPNATGAGNERFGPRDVMAWIYAVLHTPEYRKRYAEFLRGDFPRIPLPRDADQFARAIAAGHRLMTLHLMEGEEDIQTRFPIQGDNIVDKPRYAEGRVYINATQYFDGVDKSVWDHSIGGYQVMDKWLKDRKGRALSYDDILHYQRIAAILAETRAIMAELDAVWEG